MRGEAPTTVRRTPSPSSIVELPIRAWVVKTWIR